MDEQLNAIEVEIERRKTEQPQDALPTVAEPPAPQLRPINAPSAFTQAVDQAKIATITEVAATDKHFVKGFAGTVTDAAMESAKVEQEKQKLERLLVEHQQELIETKRQLNKLEQQTTKWEKRQKRRQFFYDGVKPIMLFMDIKEPTNILFALIITIIAFPIFLGGKILRATFGNLLVGATDADRPKAVRSFLATILAISVVLVLAFVVLLALEYLGITNIIKGGNINV